MTDPLLRVDNLQTHFDTADGVVRAVNGTSFTVSAGEIVGLVGESGSGKSVTARSIMGLQAPGQIVEGSIHFDGEDLTECSDRTLERYRGTRLSMLFQDPMTTLNPVFDVGEQIAESLRVHEHPKQSLLDFSHVPGFADRSSWRRNRERAVELMEQVGVADPADRVEAYPHELSGGMAQRAMLAIALAGDPDLLIADEPTTALDMTTQARILEQLRSLARETETAILLITHNLGVVAELCDRVVVMYGGEIMERGPTDRLLHAPEHPYTIGLRECLLDGTDAERLDSIDGRVPDCFEGGSGCAFASRCDFATVRCSVENPPVVDVTPDHEVVCSELEVVRTETEAAAAAETAGADIAVDGGTPLRSETGPDALGRRDAVGQDEAARSTADVELRSDEGHPGTPILEARDVTKTFDLSNSLLDRLFGTARTLRAIDDVDIAVHPGETVGIVGESGSGKSTLAKVLTGLHEPTGGEVRFDGEPANGLASRSAEQLADIGVVFQAPRSSINPRLTVREAIAEPLYEQGWNRERRDRRVEELLDLVDLPTAVADRRPGQLSGGQLQRIAIARAIALEPRVVVFDEPVSALDVSVRATLLNLLVELQDRLGLTYLVISHDLDVVRHLADRIAVMYLGEIVERGPANTLFERPSHPYTQALLDAIPRVDENDRSVTLAGPIPSSVERPTGCSFHPRCRYAVPKCSESVPDSRVIGAAASRCHLAEEVAATNDASREDDRTQPTRNP